MTPNLIFISYNTKDRAEVLRSLPFVLTTIKAENRWLDCDEIHVGDPISERVETAIKTCTHFVTFVGRHGLGPWQRIECDAAHLLALNGGAPSRCVAVLEGGSAFAAPFTYWGLRYIDARTGQSWRTPVAFHHRAGALLVALALALMVTLPNTTLSAMPRELRRSSEWVDLPTPSGRVLQVMPTEFTLGMAWVVDVGRRSPGMSDRRCVGPGDSPAFPLNCVTQAESERYCAAIGGRLPTPDEAREIVGFLRRTASENRPGETDWIMTTANYELQKVATRKSVANLFDLRGNVSELLAGCYKANPDGSCDAVPTLDGNVESMATDVTGEPVVGSIWPGAAWNHGFRCVRDAPAP